jgi:undecaprenyl-diphosphatase
VITAIIGLSGKSFFESLFSSTTAVAVALVVTGITLIFTKRFMQGKRDSLGLTDAFILGLTQSIAIIPGISRSGITISTLLFRGIEREKSMRISFLAGIPVIFAAALLESRKIDFALKTEWRGMLLGFLASFVFGIIALKILKLILQKARLHYFGYYCIFIALITLIFLK